MFNFDNKIYLDISEEKNKQNFVNIIRTSCTIESCERQGGPGKRVR